MTPVVAGGSPNPDAIRKDPLRSGEMNGIVPDLLRKTIGINSASHGIGDLRGPIRRSYGGHVLGTP
jgi:hypothetical protein